VLAAVGVCGCGTGKTLQVTKIDLVALPPANVAVYMKVSREDGQPVTLSATDFNVYEDGKAVKKARRALLPPQMAVDRFVLLLVDLSGPLVDSEYLPALHDAIVSTTGRLGNGVHVGVGAFDGDGVKIFVPFDAVVRGKGFAELRKFRPANRTVDLWGAFITGLDQLREVSRQSPLAHRETTLVVVTDRRDKAGRHSADEVAARVDKARGDVYVIGLGDGVDREALEPIGRSGAWFVGQPRDLEKPFANLADRIESRLAQDYVFAYCSPKRDSRKSGKHTLEIRIKSHRWVGSLEESFSARGFDRDACDPAEPISFSPAGDPGDKPRREGNPRTAESRRAAIGGDAVPKL
jgi:hypothetical protein